MTTPGWGLRLDPSLDLSAPMAETRQAVGSLLRQGSSQLRDQEPWT